jgi:hypothetical protein
MIAGRAVDLGDVKGILHTKGKSIDYGYIDTWLSEFAKIDEHKNVLTEFEKLRKI